MQILRPILRQWINLFLGLVGLRVVSAEWGPRGFEASFRRAFLQGFAPKTVIDIGASDGRWARECMRVFSKAHYFLIDPLPQNLMPLERLAKSSKRVKIWQGALGATHTRLCLNLHGHQSSFYSSAEYAGTTKLVEVRPLDSFLESEGFIEPLLIKADVQGYELEVLRGGSRCLSLADMVLLEVSFRRIYQGSPLAHEIIAYLGSKGFRIYDICSYAQRPRDGELAQADILFVRENSKLFAYEGWR